MDPVSDEGADQARRPTMRRRRLGLLAVSLLLPLVACGSASSNAKDATSSASSTPTPTQTPSSSPSPTPTSTAAPTPPPTTAAAPAQDPSGPTKVLVVIEENHSLDQMKQGMPFLAGLSATYGYATHWTALTHPSEPNYIGIAGGSTFGIHDDAPPDAHAAAIGSATTVFDQAIAADKTAATYAESMPSNCHRSDSPDPQTGAGAYAVRHNPWVYFPTTRGSCLAHDQDLSAFAHDAQSNALPNVGFLIPDLRHDAHDGTLATADAWLATQLRPVLDSTDFTRGRLVIVVTADEDDRHAGNVVLTSVLTPRISHAVVNTPLTHYSLTRFLAQVLGVQPLGNGAQAPDMAAAFGL